MKTVPTESARAACRRQQAMGPPRLDASFSPRISRRSSLIWSHRHRPPRVSLGRRFSGSGASGGVAKRNRLEESAGCRME